MSRYECVTEWLFWHVVPPYDSATIVTKHWFLWSAKYFRFAVLCPFGPRPIGIALSCTIRRTTPAAEQGEGA